MPGFSEAGSRLELELVQHSSCFERLEGPRSARQLLRRAHRTGRRAHRCVEASVRLSSRGSRRSEERRAGIGIMDNGRAVFGLARGLVTVGKA